MGAKELERLREQWVELHNQGKKKEADKLYWENLFPLVRKSFRQKCREYSARYDALMMTVGTTPQPLILTLEAVRPKRVFFLYTSETEKDLKTIIREVDFLREHEVQYDREKVDPDDPEEIYEKIGKRWQEWSREGLSRVALDSTGGKKSMVSAAASAANFLGIDLLYVDHEEYLPELRTPKPGTEYLTCLPNPYITLGDMKIRQCLDLFNACSFEAAEEKLREAREEIKGKRAQQVATRLEVWHGLVKGFALWDRFHYRPAYDELQKAFKSAKKFEMEIDLDGLEQNLAGLEALKSEQRGDELFPLLQRNPEFGLRLAVDLYCNATRREKAGAPDDAAVRLYRSLELASQLRLAHAVGKDGKVGFETSKFEWERLPESVLARYIALAEQVFVEERRKRPRGTQDQVYVRTRGPVGIMHGHLILAAFGDPLWRKEGVDELKAFHKAVNKRNRLMLIHGTKRAKPEDVDEFANWVAVILKRLARLMGEDLDELVDQHTFIVL